MQQETQIEQMSEIATIGNIFFEPGKTFESLREKPFFIIGTIILCFFTLVYSISFAQKIGEEGYRRFFIEQNEKNPQFSTYTAEQRNEILEAQVRSTKWINYISPVVLVVYLALGGLIAWAIARAMGSDASYLQSFSLWLYSSLPPSIVFMIANLIVLFFKKSSEVSVIDQQRGLVGANLSFLIGGNSPALATLVASFDLFILWGWVLFAIGLQKIARLSSASAWTITAILFVITSSLKVITAFVSSA
ncbi:MAG: YIP1 family protein [Acidobacteria bacterium]|jgi:hypothetical protein|nr:MAG: YIP1 family protein [Acidobacteriota bacterium]GIU82627.1 MAG: hypothetical protein KatS3mg006_1691 [Pyrinomonadaceae bacterium]